MPDQTEDACCQKPAPPRDGPPPAACARWKLAVLWVTLLTVFNYSPFHMPHMVVNALVLPVLFVFAVRWRRWVAAAVALLIVPLLVEPWQELKLGIDEYRAGTAHLQQYSLPDWDPNTRERRDHCFVDAQTGCWVFFGGGCTIPPHDPHSWYSRDDSAYYAGVLLMVRLHGPMRTPPHPH